MRALFQKSPTDSRPDLYVPAHLREWYPAALEQVRENVTTFTDRLWFENLSTSLRFLLADLIAGENHHGVQPGSVVEPSRRYVHKPIVMDGRTGRTSQIMTESVLESYEDTTPERKKHWAEYEYSETHAAEFAAEVEELVEKVLADPIRAWEVYQHSCALSIAADQKRRSDGAARAEQARLRLELCPVCGESDAQIIGKVTTRRVLDGRDPAYKRSAATLRSCHLCWEFARDVYLAQHAATATGENRVDLVRAALTEKEG